MKKILIIVSAVLILLIGSIYVINELSQSRSFQFYGGLVTEVKTDEKVVALTFDDGPGINTQEILDILNTNEVKGTFYLTGAEIEQDVEAAKSIVQAGHEIGNHTYSHQRMVFKSPAFIREELVRTDAIIRDIGYEGEITFRPPFGRRLILLPYYLFSQEKKTILWSIEPESYPEIAHDAQGMVNHVVENVRPGSIILLHVMYESRRASLNAVEGIIISLKEQGYTFATVSELLEYETSK